MFSQTCCVCTSILPMPAMVPSAHRAVMPEMKTKRPRAAIEVAWEKCPLGLRIFEEVICVFGIHRSLPLGPMRRGKLAEQTMARRFDDAVAIFVFDQRVMSFEPERTTQSTAP